MSQRFDQLPTGKQMGNLTVLSNAQTKKKWFNFYDTFQRRMEVALEMKVREERISPRDTGQLTSFNLRRST